MKEYIKYFSGITAADGYKIVDTPFISSIETTGGTFVNLRTTEEDKQISVVDGQPEVVEYVDDRFRFVSNGNSSVGLEKLSTGQTVEYSFDGENWSGMTTATTTADTVSLSDGQKMYVRGMLSSNNTSSKRTQFKMTGNISLAGNLNYLWDYTNLDAPLKQYCGKGLFSGCTAITDASKLVLPATTLAQNCYYSMFAGCTSLTTAPALPATTLAERCYQYMFEGCTSLVSSPSLPATTLADYCYQSMFIGCTSLTTAPELPATSLAKSCYSSMFAGCRSLTTAPELPATTLANNCYNSMFRGCIHLNYIKCLATNIPDSACTSSWVDSVAANGTFVKAPSMSSWRTGVSGIPSGWTVQDATD